MAKWAEPKDGKTYVVQYADSRYVKELETRIGVLERQCMFLEDALIRAGIIADD